jgi:hypothetical protein
MSSARKIAANRRNAKSSTGPRSAVGKGRSKLNALRHGLAVIAPKPGALPRELKRLAAAFAGPDPDPCRWHFAVLAAEAEFELRRVRTARLERFGSTIATGSSASGAEHEQNLAIVLSDLVCLDRYERRALSRRNKVLRLL